MVVTSAVIVVAVAMCFLRPKKKRKVLKPNEAVALQDAEYTVRKLRVPRLVGLPLRIFSMALESPLRVFLIPRMMREAGLLQVLREVDVPERPTFEPLLPADYGEGPTSSTSILDETMPSAPARLQATVVGLYKDFVSPMAVPGMGHRRTPSRSKVYASIRDFGNAFRLGQTTPSEVAERIISFIADSEARHPPMRFFISSNEDDIRQQAFASTERYRKDEPLSLLDGVPVAVKDDIDCLPYKSTGGTNWLANERPVMADAYVVQRLRQCGAVIIGKANMQEISLGVTGINPHYGTCRNPHNPNHFPGGSSSGPAAVVAAGICPVAIGSDSSGSIRIPASLCGVVGLKGTFGRISVHGHITTSFTVSNVGPITSSVEDALLAYAVIAGPDEHDKISMLQPAVKVPIMNEMTTATELEGARLGVYFDWFDDADESVVQVCQRVLDDLHREYRTEVVDVKIPELEELRVAHMCTLASEVSQSMDGTWRADSLRRMAMDTRVHLTIARAFSACDYLLSQRIKTRAIEFHMRALALADVLVVPTTGVTAPPVKADGLLSGESDLTLADNLMKFTLNANFVGLPAITVPVGVDERGLPIGLQIIGRPWGEDLLFRLAAAVEVRGQPGE
eukprot:jgi/Mesvir1/13460/Mv16519-RA.1